jgi:hypothetical protein
LMASEPNLIQLWVNQLWNLLFLTDTSILGFF